MILFSVEQCVHPGDDPDDYREHCEHGSPVRPGDNQGGVQETDRLVYHIKLK